MSIRIGLWLPSSWQKLPNKDVDNIDLLILPESHDKWENISSWRSYSKQTNTAVYVGLNHPDGMEMGYFINPRTNTEITYTKHSTADKIAFEFNSWNTDMLKVVRVGDLQIGLTICHDHYISSLMNYQAEVKDVDVLCNISKTPVKVRKWGEILQARAIENSCYTFCTTHTTNFDGKEPHSNSGNVFAFSDTGEPLLLRDSRGRFTNIFDSKSDELYTYEIDTTSDNSIENEITRVRTNKASKEINTDNSVKVSLNSGKNILLEYNGGSDTVDLTTNEDVTVCLNDKSITANIMSINEILSPALCTDSILEYSNKDSVQFVFTEVENKSRKSFYNNIEPVIRARVVEWCLPFIVKINDELVGYHLANTSKDTHRLDRSPIPIKLDRVWGTSSALKPIKHHERELLEVVDEIKDSLSVN